MSTPDKEFEVQLSEAGKKLLDPPSSVEELLPLLDKAEYYLSRVEQSPSKSIESALSPCMKALVADKLFRHSDIDVKVAVASCISEITRISAPEAPYEDDLMKEAFQLIVSSFELLDDKSSRSFEKRASILATVAKVRSCVVMLDLECDALILQMFQHFLKTIRDYHPEHVLTSMETVMTLVIEESEDISPELLFPMLSTLKKDNEGVLPVAKKLAEKVIENCSSKLNAALGQALSSLGTSANDYSEVVSLVCQTNNAEKSRADANAAAEQEVDNEATSPKSEVSCGAKHTAEDDPSTDSVSAKKHENADQKTEVEITGDANDYKPVKSENGKETSTEHKQKKTTRKRGRKPSAVKKSTKPAESDSEDEKEPAQSLDDEKDAKSNNEKDAKSDNEKDANSDNEKDAKSDNEKDAKSDNEKDAKSDNEKDAKSNNYKDAKSDIDKDTESNDDKDGKSEDEKDAKSENDKEGMSDDPSLQQEDQPVEKDFHSDGEKDVDVASSPKEEDNDFMDVSSPSKSAEPKKKEGSLEESEGPCDSEKKAPAEDEKKTEDEASDEGKTPITAKTSRKGSEATGDVEADSVKKSSQKVSFSTADKDGASSKSLKKKKEPMKGKMGRPKDKTSSFKKDAEKEAGSSSKLGKKRQRDEDQLDETPKAKGKRTPVKEVGSSTKEHGTDLVGAKVRVLWPDDDKYYKGVVKSFNPVSRRHRIVYNDGDVETLRLKDEKWELLEDDSSSSEEEEAVEEACESSPDVPSKKSKTSTGKAAKSSGKLKKGKPSGSVKGKPSSSKRKAKQSEADEESEDESDKEQSPEPSKTSAGSKAPGNKTPASGTKSSGSKTGGSGVKSGSKTGKKRRRGA